MSNHSAPILDSHVHLFTQSDLPNLAWSAPNHPLAASHTIKEYLAATKNNTRVQGFIFIETDRVTHPNPATPDIKALSDPASWTHALEEVAFISGLATGTARKDEGASASQRHLVKGIIPWAPLPAGAASLERYLAEVKKASGTAWPKIRGYRYLLQDKPNGTMLTEEFIQSVRLLGKKGMVFEVGVDQHRRGKTQLEEVVEMIDRVHEGVDETEKTVFIINHLLKPDLTPNYLSSPTYHSWRSTIFLLSKCPSVYIKLSGALSEMTPTLRSQSPEHIFEACVPWLAPLTAVFGAKRLMFGSDWPVCTVTGEEGDGKDGKERVDAGSWEKWRMVVERLCRMASFGEEETEMVFAGTARAAYGLNMINE